MQATSRNQKSPSKTDTGHFLTDGNVKLTACFTREQASYLTFVLNLPRKTLHQQNKPDSQAHSHAYLHDLPGQKFPPKIQAAMCDPLGGADRIAD